MGKLTSVKEPGLRIKLPFLQTMIKVDMRTRVLELENQDIFTKDNVSTKLNAITYFKVVDPQKATLDIVHLENAVHQIIQGQLRDTLSGQEFSEILSHREALSKDVLKNVVEMAHKWGVEIEKVQLKNLDIVDPNMVRAMAKEAEATNEGPD